MREPGHVRIEEVFLAPRSRVFDAWVKPELLALWYAPRGCSLFIEHMDVRPGGRFHIRIHNPSFGDCWTVGTYLEVVAPERLVFTSAIADEVGDRSEPQDQGHDPAWPSETTIRVTFREREGRTLVTLEQDVSAELAERTGALPSWREMLQGLGLMLGGAEATFSDPTKSHSHS